MSASSSVAIAKAMTDALVIRSKNPVVQKQEHALRGFPRLVDDFGFRGLPRAQQHLVKDASLQQSSEHLRRGALVAHVPALALHPQIEIAGFRGVAGMIEALAGGDLDVVGLARPLIADPEAPRRLPTGETDKLLSPESTLNVFHILPWNTMQIERLGDSLDPDLSLTGEAAMAAFVELEGRNKAALLDSRGRRAA
jgi:hypothetical protein